MLKMGPGNHRNGSILAFGAIPMHDLCLTFFFFNTLVHNMVSIVIWYPNANSKGVELLTVFPISQHSQKSLCKLYLSSALFC